MTNKNKTLIELSTNLLNQVSGGCNRKCTCDEVLDNIKEIPDKISDALPDTSKIEDRVKKVPEKVNTFFHEL